MFLIKFNVLWRSVFAKIPRILCFCDLDRVRVCKNTSLCSQKYLANNRIPTRYAQVNKSLLSILWITYFIFCDLYHTGLMLLIFWSCSAIFCDYQPCKSSYSKYYASFTQKKFFKINRVCKNTSLFRSTHQLCNFTALP